jgi:hypothetical protein
MKSFLTLLFSLVLISGFQAQNGLVRGRVFNAQTNASIEGAKVQLIEQAKGTITKVDGTFELTGLKPGVYSFKAVSIGFKEQVFNIFQNFNKDIQVALFSATLPSYILRNFQKA